MKPWRGSNGAVVSYDPLRRRYVIEDCEGREHGCRRDLAAAKAFAATLPGTPYVPPPEPTTNLSPRADPVLRRRLNAAEPPVPLPEEMPEDRKPRVDRTRGLETTGRRLRRDGVEW
jgi:hypothetical protein